MATLPEVWYRLTQPARGQRPGHHRSRSAGAGFEFRDHVPLIDAPDARRLDLHASLRDPLQRWLVRRFEERRDTTVAVVADFSASMGDAGRPPKAEVLADLVASLAHSAWRTGDAFTFLACGEQVLAPWTLPPTRQRGAGLALAERLRREPPAAASAQGLLQAHGHLPARRGLVFLVSDFLFPPPLVDAVLASLAAHEVVPVVLRQAGESALAGRRGLAFVAEPESGRRQWVWWRPALAARWAQADAAHRAALDACWQRYRRAPLVLSAGFDADAMTRHFIA